MSTQQITPKIITKNGYMKMSFEHLPGNEKRKAESRKLIEVIKVKLQSGLEDYLTIADKLLDENLITFEKHQDNGLFYVSRSSLSNYITKSRGELGMVYVYSKDKILEMFDKGFSRDEIVAAGFRDTNVYAVLKRNGRIERKNKRG